MQKKFRLILVLIIGVIFALGSNITASASGTEVYIGGMPAGFTVSGTGAEIVGICDVLTEGGLVCPSKNAGLNVGDVVVSIDNNKVYSAREIDDVINKINGKKCLIEYKRSSQTLSSEIKPAQDMASGKYRLGVLIRDSVSGIGTVTYIEKNTKKFGSLGHGVLNEKGELININSGKIYNCSITGVVKGQRGKAGELKGMFIVDKPIATADRNTNCGIYGKFCDDYDFGALKTTTCAGISEVKMGDATIYTTINGITPKEYNIEIVKIDRNNKQNKNFVLKIDDKDLLEISGGIVQGMSGSPIIQNGKLVGAVTHVFLNDSTRGYGISIEKMLAS